MDALSGSPGKTPGAPPVTAVVVTVAMTALIALGHDGPLARALEPVELRTLDARFRARGEERPHSDVVLVAFDDKTLRDAPELAQRRTGVAAVLDAIHAGGARVIGIDAFFAEPESPLAPKLSEDVRAFVASERFAETPEPAASLLRRVRDEANGDDVLEAALRDDVILAVHRAHSDGLLLDDETLRRSRYGQLGAMVDPSGEPARIVTAKQVLASLPRFTRKAGASGLVSIELDEDQVGRRLSAARRHEGAVLAPLAVHVAARAMNVSPARVAYLPGQAIVIGDVRIPLLAPSSASGGDAVLLNFRGKRGTFPTYSAVDVVRGALSADALRDKPVLVGFTYLSHDVSPTPFDGRAPGLEVHATAVDNLIAGDALRRAPVLVDAGLALVLGLLVAAAYTRVGPQRASLRIGASAFLVVAAVAIAHVAFMQSETWVGLAAPALTTALASASALVTAYVTEGAERRRLRKAFAHYLADEIIDELMRNPAALSLGGGRRDVTLLFSDIRGFTTLSERLSPPQLSSFLNRYLTPMTRAVLAERGFLDKYIGDALMAVFGAPAPSTDHPDRAVAAALRMHAALLELRARDPAMADLSIGVGINSGDVVAGNMGSEERFDYTVIGDAVNLASRLEALTKRYGVFCIVGDDTRRRLSPSSSPDAPRFREIDLVRVKGRAAPVAIHELIPPTLSPAYVDLDAFARALADYRAGRFVEARTVFGAWRAQNPHDTVAALYLERLAQLGDAPANGSTWDGVFDHHEK